MVGADYFMQKATKTMTITRGGWQYVMLRRWQTVRCHAEAAARCESETNDACGSQGGQVCCFDICPLSWLRTPARGSFSLRSAAAIDAGDVPLGHDATESSRLRSARVQMCNSRCPRWPILPSESVAVAVESFWWA